MPEETHTHKYKGVSVYENGHLHLFSGVSSAAPNTEGHTHIISGQTTVEDNHSHHYSFPTQGPTYVDREHYKHYHYFQGATDVVNGHSHPMSGTTFVLGE